jgi:hypothetical protein
MSGLTSAAETAAIEAPRVDPERVEADVETLHRAMAGLGTDEQAIHDVLENRSPEERSAIEERFAEQHGDAWITLRVAIDRELSGDDRARAVAALDADRDLASRGEIMADYGKGGPLGRPLRRFVTWFEFGVGGKTDAEDGLPRLTGADVRRDLLPQLRPGDVVLCGNNGGVSHAMVYLGDNRMVHSMATEKTMRGRGGRIWDTITAPVDLLRERAGLKERKQGVFIEEVDAFFDRFERDTYIVMRSPGLTPQQTTAGLDRVRELVGKPYDWDFTPGNDAYYCTEVTGEFYRAALGEDAPRIGATPQDYGALLRRTAVVDPQDVLASPDLVPVLSNDAARGAYPERLGGSD